MRQHEKEKQDCRWSPGAALKGMFIYEHRHEGEYITMRTMIENYNFMAMFFIHMHFSWKKKYSHGNEQLI